MQQEAPADRILAKVSIESMTAMSAILLICPTHRDLRELSRVSPRAVQDAQIFEYASDALEALTARRNRAPVPVESPLQALTSVRRLAEACDVSAVVSTDDYPGSTLAAIIADDFGLPGSPPLATTRCQHKVAARDVQRLHAPECVPEYQAFAPGSPVTLPLPFVVKPTKSFFSVGATRVDHTGQVAAAVDGAMLPTAFFEPFNAFADECHAPRIEDAPLIAECMLIGQQVTLEGYAWRGEIHAIGIVDSVMFPGTTVFQRFEYPSCVPAHIEARMRNVASRVMRAVEFHHGLFNIEFIYDERRDSLGIIEINPRMSSQFADLFEKVDGTNTYEVLLDLALGVEPKIRRRAGRHAFAASCVLRTFIDQYVAAMPSQREVDRLIDSDADLRIEPLADVGTRLSEAMQDVASYRYGVVNVGGRDRQDAEQVLARCLGHLTFELYPV